MRRSETNQGIEGKGYGMTDAQVLMLREPQRDVHRQNRRWWENENGNLIVRNRGELLMLIVSEVAEGMEGERKGLQDDQLPHRPMAEVELADALIRLFGYAGGFGYELAGAMREKLAFNRTRKDHTHAARNVLGGKMW